MTIGPYGGEPSRKQPWYVPGPEQWTNELVVASHVEALWLLGESSLYTMMWRPDDYKAGLVGLCQECMGRSARAFNQSERKKCLSCYGTTYEGGIKRQIIRPSIWGDRNIETTDTVRGVVQIDSISVETTPDFVFHKGDYIFRADGTRYQAEEKGEAVLRTGYAFPDHRDSFRGSISAARLEEETAVAYLIPPIDPMALATLLGGPPKSEEVPVSNDEQVFTFSDAQTTWEVLHNLQSLVPGTVVVTNMTDEAMWAEIDYISPTKLIVRWPEPMTGKVRVRP